MAVPVFIIVLNRNPRCEGLCRQLDKSRIPYEVVLAVDARELDEDDLSGVYDDSRAIKRFGRSLAPAEIGCALSHRSVYAMLVERAIPIALILEEDAILGPDFEALWRASDTLPSDIDVLSLYSTYGFVRRRAAASLGRCTVHEATLVLASTVAYYIRQSCARALLGNNTPVSTVADWPFVHGAVRQFLTVPMVVGHADGGSVIAPQRPTFNILGRYHAPRWFSAIFHLSFLGYVLQPKRYEGFNGYYRREISRRLRQIFAPGQLDVRDLTTDISPSRGRRM